MAGEKHVPLPTPMAPIVDAEGRLTVAWVTWFRMIDARIGGFNDVMLPSGVNWTSGTGAPIAAQPVGSLYSQEDGTVGATLYVSQGGGVWTVVG